MRKRRKQTKIPVISDECPAKMPALLQGRGNDMAQDRHGQHSYGPHEAYQAASAEGVVWGDRSAASWKAYAEIKRALETSPKTEPNRDGGPHQDLPMEGTVKGVELEGYGAGCAKTKRLCVRVWTSSGH